MPVFFDEVSVDVERDAPRGGSVPGAAPPAAPAPLPREQIERELRLIAERQARVADE